MPRGGATDYWYKYIGTKSKGGIRPHNDKPGSVRYQHKWVRIDRPFGLWILDIGTSSPIDISGYPHIPVGQHYAVSLTVFLNKRLETSPPRWVEYEIKKSTYPNQV